MGHGEVLKKADTTNFVMKKETLKSFVMEKADTTKICNEKSEHYKNFITEKCDNQICKESRFCGEGW